MPTTSSAQHRLMEAAAHTKGGFGGVPQSVGKEFAEADKRAGKDSASPHLESIRRHFHGAIDTTIGKEFTPHHWRKVAGAVARHFGR